MYGIKHKLQMYESSIDTSHHYATAIVSYKTARYFCESFNQENILFTMVLNGCTGFPSYWPKDSCIDPRPNVAAA